MGMSLFMAIPWLMFCVISIVFTFAYHHYWLVSWVVVLSWIALSLMFIAIRNRMKGSWFGFIGILCIFACVSGTCAGLYNYYTNMFQYWCYDENRAYTNVLPTEPAAAHADAGKIVFSNSARVDTTRAVGYQVGTVYCVAPILDDSQMDRVEYWAVGTDCCPSRGDFNCDDAWNPNAKSGVVILDATDWFATKHDYYMKAVKQAEAAYQLSGADMPLFVRWVSDGEALQASFWRRGIGFLFATLAMYLLFSIIAGAIIQTVSKRKAKAEGGSPFPTN